MLATAVLRTKTNALGATIFLFSELYGKRIVQLFKSKKESNSKKYFNAFYSKPGLKKNKNKKQSHKGEGCTEKPRIGGGVSRDSLRSSARNSSRCCMSKHISTGLSQNNRCYVKISQTIKFKNNVIKSRKFKVIMEKGVDLLYYIEKRNPR